MDRREYKIYNQRNCKHYSGVCHFKKSEDQQHGMNLQYQLALVLDMYLTTSSSIVADLTLQSCPQIDKWPRRGRRRFACGSIHDDGDLGWDCELIHQPVYVQWDAGDGELNRDQTRSNLF